MRDEGRMVIASDGITTAGAAFGHVALAVVHTTSPAVADLVTRYLVIDERPSQSVYAIPSALAQSDPAVAAFECWARERLAEPISIPQAAKTIGVSERTLQRSVQRTLGTSPIRFIQDLRIERASHLLRTTEQSLETISRKVGYENPSTLRVLLRGRTGKPRRPLEAGSRSNHFEGDLDEERGSASDRARDRHRAAARLHAVDQPGESGPLGGISPTVAVVANEKTKRRTLGFYAHID